MGRTRKLSDEEQAEQTVASLVSKEQEEDISAMPLNSLADYMRYNEKARAANKKLKLNRYLIKPCPVELHPMERVEFSRNDQPNNPLPVYVSDHMIHYDRTAPRDRLMPGQVYDLPRYVVNILAAKGTPKWGWFDNPDGSRETRKISITPRFAFRTIYKD